MPVLVILAILWAVVLLPPLLRSRSRRTVSSIVDFNRKLDVLGRTNGGVDDPTASTIPTASTPAVVTGPPLEVALAQARAAGRSGKRRRDVMRVLTVAVTVTLLLAAATNAPVAWGFQVLADLSMMAYLALWAWLRTAQAERVEKVRYLPEPRPRTPELALRRSASS